MGAVATDEKQALRNESVCGLAEAGELVERGDLKAALKLLEQARRKAVAAEDVEALRQVLDETRLAHARSEQKQRNEAVRIRNAAQQDIRVLTRKAALSEGREWVDPFGGPGADRGEKLWVHLAASFGFCAFWGLAGILEAETFEFWFSWMAGWGVYWLVFALLQVRWWRKGYDHFWRPVYSWVLTAVGAVMLSIPALLMFALPLGEVARGVVFVVVWLAVLAAPLIAPRSRRWLLQQLRPYDSRPRWPSPT